MSNVVDSQGIVALVTGASRGIGEGIARALLQAGYTVYGTATTAKGAEAISGYLGNGRGLVMQLTEPDSIIEAVASIDAKVGAVGVLVNNAGMTRDQLLLRSRDTDWLEVIDANLTGSMRVTKACLKGMIKQRYGRIIHLSSVVASMGNPGQTNYAAAKAGLEGFSRSLSLEVASRGITSNVIAPGFIQTDMTASLSESQSASLTQSIPVGRLGEVSDIAAAAVFLAGREAGYITGQTLHINGGMYLS